MERSESRRSGFEVWVEADLCSGCGRCVETAPSIFTHIEGTSHVIENGQVLEPGDRASVSKEDYGLVKTAAEDCPGEVIWLDKASK